MAITSFEAKVRHH